MFFKMVLPQLTIMIDKTAVPTSEQQYIYTHIYSSDSTHLTMSGSQLSPCDEKPASKKVSLRPECADVHVTVQLVQSRSQSYLQLILWCPLCTTATSANALYPHRLKKCLSQASISAMLIGLCDNLILISHGIVQDSDNDVKKDLSTFKL